MGSLADRLRVAAVGAASSWDAGEIVLAIAPVAPSPLAPAPVPAAAVHDGHLISRSASPEFDGGFWDDGVVGDGLGWVLRKNRVAAWFPELKARERRRGRRGDVEVARAEAEWLRRRRERDEAARLANRVLDFMRVDPDGDLAILARAFLRDH